MGLSNNVIDKRDAVAYNLSMIDKAVPIPKWEIKERARMGDAAFVAKYIKIYEGCDKMNKSVFPFICCACVALLVWRIVETIGNPSFDNYAFAIISLILAATWIFLTQMYFSHGSRGMYGKYIERWVAERDSKISSSDQS